MRHTPDNDKLFDGVLLQNAVSFCAAADAYAKADQLRDWFALYFLIGQSMELAFKAFAINKGATDKQLRRVGHDLIKALDQAEALRFGAELKLTSADRASIGLLGKWHLEQLTRYPLLQGYSIPRPVLVREILGRIIEAVYVVIWGKAQFEHDRASDRGLGLLVDVEAVYGGG
jgi:hypothetical protein